MITLQRQSGVMLLEALIGILIFAIGILGLLGMQAAALQGVQDARYRTEAALYANDLLNQIQLNVNRANQGLNLTASLAPFAHQTGGADCVFSGGASPNAIVTDWAALAAGTVSPRPAGARPPLPGTTASMLQVAVVSNPAAMDYNRVTITVCWKAKDDAVARQHVLTSYVY